MDQDRRYQVFISSPFAGLENERKAAIEAVYEAGHIPIALDHFPPTSKSNIYVIERAMESCQIYMLILGHRYGSLMEGSNISFTEFEFNLALKHDLHVLNFIMDKDIFAQKRAALRATDIADSKELSNYPLFENFLQRLSQYFNAYWTADNFKYKVGIALATNVRECKKPGYIREPGDPTVLDTARNEFIVDIVSELKGFTKLYQRCSQNQFGKRSLTKFFVERYMDAITRNEVNLFLESGSTIAFLAKEMAPYLKGSIVVRDKAPNISITTNNVLAYLLLWLKARIPCSQFPWSPPFEETYGALYAGIAGLTKKQPDYLQHSLDSFVETEIKKLLEDSYAPRHDDQKITLLLGTSSGLQIQEPRDIRFGPEIIDSRKEELRQQILSCFGPHVGSYHNKIFKRFMYATKLPLVLFIDGEKVDCAVEVGKCHYILDESLTWDSFITNHPVAFCIGCREESATEVKSKKVIMSYFSDHGFKIIEENSTSAIESFIARNDAFIEQFEKRCSFTPK
jgi:hypothetical protein